MTRATFDPETLGQLPTPATHGVLSREQRDIAEAIIAKYPNKRSAALPLLFLVQSVEGHVTEAGMREVGELIDLTPAEVLATASFYTMLKKTPQGEYLISVCRNIACMHRGARKVMSALEERLGIEAGATTADGKFSLEEAECLATCDGAPSMQINYEDFYRLSPDAAVALVDELERGQEVRSERNQRVRTAREVSLEIATAGLRVPGTAGDHAARTIGGVSPRADTAPGFRPKEPGTDAPAQAPPAGPRAGSTDPLVEPSVGSAESQEGLGPKDDERRRE